MLTVKQRKRYKWTIYGVFLSFILTMHIEQVLTLETIELFISFNLLIANGRGKPQSNLKETDIDCVNNWLPCYSSSILKSQMVFVDCKTYKEEEFNGSKSLV